MRAMVVDDSRAMRTILGKMLKELGFEVADAANGKEALEKLRALGAVELALVDWNMPEMDGLAFVRALRAEPAYAGVKLMMVTTEADVSNIASALKAGANEYLMKPFTREAVEEKLALLGLGSR